MTFNRIRHTSRMMLPPLCYVVHVIYIKYIMICVSGE